MSNHVDAVYLPRSNIIRHRVNEVRSLLAPMSVCNSNKIRLGKINDGGYVCIDRFEGVTSAVSLGIASEVSWDLDVANLGMKVFQYDDSVENSPVYHEYFTFNKIRVGGVDSAGVISLNSVLSSNNILYPHSVLLKMDIEGGEWETFLFATDETLNAFSQIICEFHFLSNITDINYYQNAVAVFQKLNEKFQVVHIHGNNWGKLLICPDAGTFPDVVEVTFAHRDKFTFEKNRDAFPTGYDSPNNPEFIDFYIDFPVYTNGPPG